MSPYNSISSGYSYMFFVVGSGSPALLRYTSIDTVGGVRPEFLLDISEFIVML